MEGFRLDERGVGLSLEMSFIEEGTEWWVRWWCLEFLGV
jgi:hypothetical protein